MEAFVHLQATKSKMFSHFTLGPQDQTPAPNAHSLIMDT